MEKLCLKCGMTGHTNRFCKNHVTSFGLIVLSNKNTPGRMVAHERAPCKFHDNKQLDPPENGVTDTAEPRFLLVERKDTIGFLSLIQGSYSEHEPRRSRKIEMYLADCTCQERHRFVTQCFPELWQTVASDRRDFRRAQLKWNSLDIHTWLNKVPCMYQEADYTMPKGRLKYNETVQECAVREFTEETGYRADDIELLPAPAYTEEFTGSDQKKYKNVFFLARMKRENTQVHVTLGQDTNQSKEVRNLGWFTLRECQSLMRAQHAQKLKILQQALAFFIKDGGTSTGPSAKSLSNPF